MVDEIELVERINSLPKIHCPIYHHFAPGVYLREMHIPQGTVAIGHYHKTRHFCVLSKGVAIFIGKNKKPEMITGPTTFIAEPGHKVVFAASDIIVQNIHPNPDDITDQDELEQIFIDQSNYFTTLLSDNGDHLQDRIDFEALNYVQPEWESYIDLPQPYKSVITIRKSGIHGKGIFSTCPWGSDEYIGPFITRGKVTELARYMNHSIDPNAKLSIIDQDEVIVVAKVDIDGCVGDSKGTEITIDYRELTPCLGEPSQGPPSLRSEG
jgi:hypothetical protein